MKSAKEMFEELGFEYNRFSDCIHCYNSIKEEHIWFYINAKTIEIRYDFGLKVLSAINKQVEELKWNEQRRLRTFTYFIS